MKTPKNDIGTTENFTQKEVDDEELVKIAVQPLETKITERFINSSFRICPACSSKSLKIENGCDTCLECGYSKCDK